MKKRILFVGHDANRAGAQLFLLQVIRALSNRYECTLLLLAEGELGTAYAEYSTVFYWNAPTGRWWRPTTQSSANQLNGKSFDVIYLNTIAVASVFPWLKEHVKGPFVSHLHELSFSQSLYSSPSDRAFLFAQADSFIGCSAAVSASIRPMVPVATPVETVHSFVDNEPIKARIQQGAEGVSRQALGLTNEHFLVGSCGHAEWRKGTDWFVQIAAEINSPLIHFLWIGFPETGILAEQIQFDIHRMGLSDRITLLPLTPHSVEWLAQLDLFLLCSREDPFPLVMLESALAEVPVIGFEQSGGCEEFVQNASGWVVPYGNCRRMAQQIETIQASPNDRRQAGIQARKAVENVYQFDQSMTQLDAILTRLMTP